MPVAMIIIAGVSVAMSLYAQKKQGDADKAAAEAGAESSESQAGLSIFNANTAKIQAQDALERGAEEESRFRSSVRGAIGTQRAGIAAGNIDVSYGSAVDVQADAAFLGELDALAIRTNAAREAWGFKVEEVDLRSRAEIMRREGSQKLAAGQQMVSASRYAMAGTIVGGVSTAFQTRYGWNRAGGQGYSGTGPGTPHGR